MNADLATWRELARAFDPDRPPREMGWYVEPPGDPAAALPRELAFDDQQRLKYLLLGALGCGKSTLLRQLAERVRATHLVIDIDLDASGVSASSVSAFDLLYLCSLGLLRHLPTDRTRQGHFDALRAAYAGKEDGSLLGNLTEALGGLAGFASAAGAASVALGGVVGGAPVIAAAVGAAATGLKLFAGRGEVVQVASPQGRLLQDAAARIARAVRVATGRPPLVLLDGLERMNGESEERLRAVFEYTRLLTDADWPAVIAAPPASVVAVTSLDTRGYKSVVLPGFAHAGAPQLRRALELRVESVPGAREAVAPEALDLFVERSGGFPRHAMRMAWSAARRVGYEGRDRLGVEDARAAAMDLAESLARGLNASHFRVLGEVSATQRLPDDDCVGSLFANAHILMEPGRDPGSGPRYFVHPLLERSVRDTLGRD